VEAKEVTFRDLTDGTGKSEAGYKKSEFAENRLDAIAYNNSGVVHVATTNRTTISSPRLSTPCFASVVMYVYLNDVPSPAFDTDHGLHQLRSQ
jgi:hypothetical protein